MNKHQIYNFLVLALSLGTSCYAMEPENMQEALVDIKHLPKQLVIERKLGGLELDSIRRLKCHPSKPEFVFGDSSGKNVSYDLESDSFVLNEEYKAAIFSYNPKGTLRADVSDYVIHIFDLEANDVKLSYEFEEPILEIFFNRKGTQLIVVLVDDEHFELPRNMVKTLSVVKQKCTTDVLKRLRDNRHIGSVIIPSPNRFNIACTTSTMSMENEEVVIVNWITEKVQYLCEKQAHICYDCLAFNADGTQLVAGRNDGNVTLWDLKNGISKLIQYRTVGSKVALAFGSENTLFSVSDHMFRKQNSSKLHMCKLKTHRFGSKKHKITDIPQNSGKVLESAFSDDGSKLAEVVKDKQGDIYFRYTYLLPKKCYSVEELAVMQRLYSQRLTDHD